MPGLKCVWKGRESTYPDEVGLGVVLLARIDVVVDSDEAGASAATELGLDAENCDSVFRGLELLGDVGFDVGLLDAGKLRVDQLDGLAAKKTVSAEKSGRASNLPSAFCRGAGSR